MCKKALIVFLSLVLGDVFYPANAQTKDAPMTVSVDWLSQHLNDSARNAGSTAQLDK